MKEVRLKIKKRAFPSQGRVRLNETILTGIGIQNGDPVDLINRATSATVSTMVFTDSMDEKGQARISEEDLKKIGLKEGDEVLIRPTVPFDERMKKAAGDATKTITEKAGKLKESAKKTAGDVKGGAAKAYESANRVTQEGIKKVKKKTSEKDL
jgi:formylmethanofuran dehydrogenase subunit D